MRSIRRRRIAQGRALIEKTLQREGKTAVNLDDLATRLNFKSTDDLFAAVAKEEFSLRHVEQALHDPRARRSRSSAKKMPSPRRAAHQRGAGAKSACWWWAWFADDADGAVLQAGAPAISSASSRAARVCRSIAATAERSANCRRRPSGDPTEWGKRSDAVYPVDIRSRRSTARLAARYFRMLSREKINVTGVKTLSSKGVARMQFTAEVCRGHGAARCR
jgi:GTP pyrophosphokinase